MKTAKTDNKIKEFLSDADVAIGLKSIKKLPAQAASFAELPENLNSGLTAAMKARGYEKLYIHQRKAWEFASQGRDFVVLTPTASGKTLCYNLPVLHTLMEDPEARALYLFPTKALSQDQQAELNELLESAELKFPAVTYDGDTPRAQRKMARESARIVISNPDMLHSGILPNHTKWIQFFAGLKFIVIDEMHSYRGVFGSHVANVFRRLLRIARHYGSDPVFILCSATIGNPVELAEALVGRKMDAITENGAPRPEKIFAFYNPPLVDPVQGIRRSSADESMRLSAKLLEKGVRTILFARSRLKVEILASYLNKRFSNIYNNNNNIRVEPYRSGLLPNERRNIEKGLRDGTVSGVVSTNALELGIDIGGLDAAILAAWPGSMSSFWQQAGRAGRRQDQSLAIFVASASPLDQFYVENPERCMEAKAESARIDPENPYIYTDHVKCAAFELPFREGEVFGSELESVLDFLTEGGILRQSGGRWFWASASYPAEKISLRSASADNIVIVDTTKGQNSVIGEMDIPSAKELIFDDAVYIHKGRQYVVQKLDIENRHCFVEARETNYYTDAVVKNDLKLLSEDEKPFGGLLDLIVGDILVRSSAEKYKKLRFHSNENIGYGEIFLPPEEMQTRTFAIVFGNKGQSALFLQNLGEMESASCLAGFTSMLRSMAPLELLCDYQDLGTAWRLRDDHFLLPAIYIWDRYPGGTGLAEAMAQKLDAILSAAYKRLGHCDCQYGCPSCIGVAEERFSGFKDRKASVNRLIKLVLTDLRASGLG